MRDNLSQLLDRFTAYSPVEVLLELAVIWIAIFLVIRFLKGTRGAGIIKGLALLLIVGTLVIRLLAQGGDHFQRIYYLYTRCLGFAAIALLVIFQPELRRALIRLGEASLFSSTRRGLNKTVDAVVEACSFLSKNRFGALIAIERQVGLGGLVEGGTQLNADVSARLLQSIFWPNSALHDLGVIIRGDRILAAGVQFPLAEAGELSLDLGSRHRAAVGLSNDSDCIVVVVSEETGAISIAERGHLYRDLTADDLRTLVQHRLIENEGDEPWLERFVVAPISKEARDLEPLEAEVGEPAGAAAASKAATSTGAADTDASGDGTSLSEREKPGSASREAVTDA